MKIDVEITIENNLSQGQISLDKQGLILYVDNDSKSILYSSIEEVVLSENSTILMQLNSKVIIKLKMQNAKEFYSQIIKNKEEQRNIFNEINDNPYELKKIEENHFSKALIALIVFLGVIVVLSMTILRYLGKIGAGLFYLGISITLIYVIYHLILGVKQSIQNAQENLSSKERRIHFLSKLSIFVIPIFYIGLIVYYHNSGPRAAVNDCYNDFRFVSCTDTLNTADNKIYTCYSAGKPAAVTCDKKGCTAICKR